MNYLAPAVVATVAASIGVILLFVPFVALSYRRHGELTARQFAAWAALALYACGLIAYTLLPAPKTDDYTCSSANLNPLTEFQSIMADPGGWSLLASTAMQQVVLNVVLFIPLGVFLRAMFRRGLAATALLGLAVSLAIELTQLTGVWGLYPCAYRVFATNDLLVNTAGAILGWAIGFVFLRGARQQPVDAAAPRPITASRRLLGMACDLLAVALTASAAIVLVDYLASVVGVSWEGSGADAVDSIVALVAAGALEGIVVLASGSTVGEHAVRLRGVAASRSPLGPRLVRLVLGSGGFVIVTQVPFAGLPLSIAWIVVSAVGVFATKDHRGFASAAAGMRVTDARTPR